MNTMFGFSCDARMGKHGDIKTFPADSDVCQERQMDVKTEKEYMSDQYSFIENMYDNTDIAPVTIDASDDDDENSKEESVKRCLGYGESVDEDNNPIKSESQKRLTVENVNELSDLLDAIEFSIEHDINIDNLESIEDCKERFLLHIEKERNGSTKKQQVNNLSSLLPIEK